MEEQYLLQPLLPTISATTTSSSSAATTNVYENDHDIKFSSSNAAVVSRFLLVIFIGIISLWANYEASKGFDINIINDIKDSPAGKRFNLFYISNDKATRIILNTSAFVENILYPHNNNHIIKKQVHHVSLRFTSKNLTQMVTVDTNKITNQFVINISSSIMEAANADHAIISAIQRGTARIWVWDGESRAPPRLVDGLVEYISMLAGFGQVKKIVGGELAPELSHVWWEDKDPKVVAHFLDYFEGQNKGFIQRLNQEMRERWDNRTVDNALGMDAHKYLFV